MIYQPSGSFHKGRNCLTLTTTQSYMTALHNSTDKWESYRNNGFDEREKKNTLNRLAPLQHLDFTSWCSRFEVCRTRWGASHNGSCEDSPGNKLPGCTRTSGVHCRSTFLALSNKRRDASGRQRAHWSHCQQKQHAPKGCGRVRVHASRARFTTSDVNQSATVKRQIQPLTTWEEQWPHNGSYCWLAQH